MGEARPAAPFVGLRLVVFEEVPACDRAVAAFGLRRAPFDDEGRRWVAHARGEASALGRAVPDACWAVYAARAVTPAPAARLEEALRARVGDEVFGARPGALFAALEATRREQGAEPLPRGAEALDALERELATDEADVLRWIPPACFLALCDAVGVVATREGRRVAWAECEADDDGVTPPPLLRVSAPEGPVHVPVGLDLLRWCVMPRRAGEVVPPLSAWLHDRL